MWVDIAGASAVSGAAPKTITGWLSRGGPKHGPFPAAHRFLYRLHWPLSQIEGGSGLRGHLPMTPGSPHRRGARNYARRTQGRPSSRTL